MIVHVQTRRGHEEIRELHAKHVVFGRSGDCDLVLDGEGISRRHGQLVRAPDGRWWVEDLASKNGIRVNGHVAVRQVLNPGDVVEVGTCTLTFAGPAPEGTGSSSSVTLTDESHPAVSTIEHEPAPLDRIDGRRLSILCELSKQLLDQATIQALIKSAGSALVEELGAATVVLGLTRDPEHEQERLIVYPRSAEPITLSLSILRRAMSSRRAILVTDTRLDETLAQANSIAQEGIRSALCVPLMRQDDVVGFLYLDRRRRDLPYRAGDLEFASAVGGIVGTALENANLREAEIARQRMQAELAAAHRMQEIILPSQWPAIDGWEISGRHASCREVGGDYYDAYLSGGRLWLFVADVCGKGAGAALLASAVHAGLHALAPDCTGPAALLSRLNHVLLSRELGASFVTALAMIADPATGHVLLSSAGHPGPLHLNADGLVSEIELPAAFALGMYPDLGAQEHSLDLGAGEGLLLYTDGAIEMMNTERDQFGEDRLRQLLARTMVETAADALADIQTAIEGFRSGCEQSDDLTLLFCRRMKHY